MAGKIVGRCGMRETPGDGTSRQCLRVAGHPPNQCQFQDGQAALDAATQSEEVRIDISAGAAAADIREDEVRILLTQGLNMLVDAMRSVQPPCVVTFGVGLIRIESQEDYVARMKAV